MTDVGNKPIKEKYLLALPYPICQVARVFKARDSMRYENVTFSKYM